MADITYCISECPFKDCERHKSKISKVAGGGKGWVSIADFAPTCRRYIASVVKEVSTESVVAAPAPRWSDVCGAYLGEGFKVGGGADNG